MTARDKTAAIVLTLFIWGLAGAVFGGLFAGLHTILAGLGLTGWQPLVAGAAAAAMTTSAFYSAMPVALMGSMAGVLASIGYLMAAGPRMDLPVIAGIAAAVGLLIGGFFAWSDRSTGGRSLGETFTGLLAGVGAGALLALALDLYPGRFGTFVLAAGVVALVGSLFKLSERWVVPLVGRVVPSALSAPVVAALIAVVVATGVWIMGGVTGGVLETGAQWAVANVRDEVPRGFLGGMLGGSVTGVLLEVLGLHLEEDEHAA